MQPLRAFLVILRYGPVLVSFPALDVRLASTHPLLHVIHQGRVISIDVPWIVCNEGS